MGLSVFIAYDGKACCFPEATNEQNAVIQNIRTKYATSQSLLYGKECWPVYEFYVYRGEVDCILHVFYLPKHLSLDNCTTWLDSLSLLEVKQCRERLIMYFESLKMLHSPIERHQLTMVSTKDQGFINLEKELTILRSLWNRLRTKRYVEIEYVCSDVIIGELDDELNLYHTELNTKVQRVEKDKKLIHQIVNTYLHHRYENDILDIFTQQYEGLNRKALDELMMVLKRIQHYTEYHQQPYFWTKKQLLAQRKTVLKTDKILYKYLEELRRLQNWSSDNFIVRDVLSMPHVWEQYLYKNYFNVDMTFSKPSLIYLEVGEDSKKKSEKYVKRSEPEFVDGDAVYDAKYKRISTLSMANVKDDDINKLLRDMLTHERSIGVLLYPKPMTLKEFIAFHDLSNERQEEHHTYQRTMIKEATFVRLFPKKILRLEHIFFVLRD